MKEAIRVLTLVILLGMLVLGGLARVVAQDLNSDLTDRIDAHMTHIMADLNIPGATIGIVQGDRIVYLQAYGIAGPNRPMTLDTPFMLASLSKPFTALAIMQLVETKELKLDSHVADLLDWFPYGSITVRHLLYHTSGFTEFSGNSYLNNNLVGPEALEISLQQAVIAYPPQSEPGEQYEYSNINYDLLGLIVQSVSRQPYGNYIQAHIFAPLEMNHSYTSLVDARTNNISTGYTPFYIGKQPMEPVYSGGHVASAGLFSTAEDMSHFLIAQLNAGQYGDTSILSGEGIETMHTPDYTEGLWGYGMGWQRRPLWEALQPVDLYRAIVPYRIFHQGSWHNFRTFVELLPESGWGVVVLTNANDAPHESLYWNSIFGILQILSGVDNLESISASEDWLIQNSLWIGILLVIVWIAMALLKLRQLRKWWRDPSRQPRPIPGIITAVVIPVLLDLGLIYFILFILPDLGRAPLGTLMAFSLDMRVNIYILLTMAGIWGLLRSMLYIWLLVLHRSS